MTKAFKSQLNLACSKDKLINQYSYIYFKDGFLYVSNGRVHIKQHLSLHGFSEPVQKILDGNCIHKDLFKMINSREDIALVKNHGLPGVADIIFNIAGSQVISTMKLHSEVQGEGNFVGYMNSIYEKFQLNETKSIALDPETIALVRKVFVTKSTGLTFRFNKGNGGILVTPNQNNYMEHAIITPLQLQGNYKKL